MNLTIFAIPKAFQGHIGIIQRNAIKSWTFIRPLPEILLLGDDPGTGEVARELGVRHCPHIDRNEFGTPKVNSIFETAEQEATNDLLCYANSDIILPTSLCETISNVRFVKFLIIGQRWDLDIAKEIDFDEAEWENKLKDRVRSDAKLQPPDAVDYFIFPRGSFQNIPPFAIGRTVWDNWLVFQARLSAIPVMDATQVLTVIHQNHGYGSPGGADAIWKGPEAQANLQLAGGYSSVFNSNDANFLLSSKGMKRRPLTKERINRELYLRTKRYPESAFLFRVIQKLLKPANLWDSIRATVKKTADD